MCRYVRAASYTGIEKNEYFSTANLDILTIVHIEGNKGLDNLKQIVSLNGIDIVFLVPMTFHNLVVIRVKQTILRWQIK